MKDFQGIRHFVEIRCLVFCQAILIFTFSLPFKASGQWNGATSSTDYSSLIYRNGNIKANGLSFGRYGAPLGEDLNPFSISSGSGDHDLVIFGASDAKLHLRLYDGDLKMGINTIPDVVLFNDGRAFFRKALGIGTTDPGTFKLAVEGNIGASEVVVTLQRPWPDFVFEDHYQLPSLSALEQYVKTYKHLPDVPKGEVIEGTGLSLGEMNVLLLKKVEELTLYLIEQNKRIGRLEDDNKALRLLVKQTR